MQLIERAYRVQLDLREFQQDLADSSARFLTAVIHRRGGKTLFALEWLVEHARSDPGRPGKPIRNYYIAPYRMQAKAVAFDFLQELVADDDVVVNRTDLYVEWPNRNRVQLLGADGYDKHRGRYADRVVFDETAQIPPGAWREVFRPMLADTKGRALFIGTPRGKGWFYSLFNMPAKSDSWESFYLPADTSGLIDEDELGEMRAEMTDSDYRREMLCDWNVGAPGAYFTVELDACEDNVRGGPLWNQNERVHTSWAMLPNDAIVVCYWQIERGRPVLIRAERHTQTSVDQVVRAVEDHGYLFESHSFRLIATKESAEVGSMRLRSVRSLGYRGPVIPRGEWTDEVHAMRQFIPSLLMAEDDAADAVEALRQCRAEYDEVRRTFAKIPVEDWALDYVHGMLPFVNRYRRGALKGRREPINYPERTRA